MSSRKRILIIGGGGREHALVWKLRQSPRLDEVYCTPGNAGISKDAVCFKADFGDNFSSLIDRVKKHGIDYTVVGPEVPLAEGIADAFEAAGLKIFGPTREGAQLESSKAFAKDFMKAAGIPTAAYQSFTEPAPALAYANSLGYPVVIKADGLAAGKGVIIASSAAEADQAIRSNLETRRFGESSNKVVIEEFMRGEEASILVLCDGNVFVPLAAAQDHKTLHDNDLGPNTGGMGAYSPAPLVTELLTEEIRERILNPLHAELQRRQVLYRGVMFVGLMITEDGPKVIEFNCRFGDPEIQCVLPRLKNDFVDLVEAVCEGRLHEHHLEWTTEACVCVVMASKGYPDNPETGAIITGLEDVDAEGRAMVFHAATTYEGSRTVTSGGRVLAVTALGRDLPRALDSVYKAVDKIHFDGAHFRRDIGRKALTRL